MNSKLFIGVTVVFLMLVSNLMAQQVPELREERPPTIDELMSVREVLRYKIKFSFLTVGWVDVFIERDSLINGNRAWLLKSRVVSNSSIPFVEKDTAMFNSWMFKKDSLLYSHEFWFDDVNDKEFREDVYKFDRKEGKVYMYHKKAGVANDTLKLYEPASSGHIMFYLTRIYAGTNHHFEAPIYVDEGLGKIIMNFTTRREMLKVDAFENKVNAFYAEGTSTITGPFGLNGDFKAWYAGDELRIPLETHLKVFLGNVKVKLIDYKRTVIHADD